MVAIIRRALPLFLAFAVLGLTAFAAPSPAGGSSSSRETQAQMDSHYVTTANAIQGGIVADQGHTWSAVPTGNFHHLEPELLQAASSGRSVTFVGAETPMAKSGMFGKKKPVGPKATYFYSLVYPDTRLGDRMGLGKDKMASVTWKHSDGTTRLVGVQHFEHVPDVQWTGMRELSDILQHH